VIQAKLKFATLSRDGTVMGLTVLRDCSNAGCWWFVVPHVLKPEQMASHSNGNGGAPVKLCGFSLFGRSGLRLLATILADLSTFSTNVESGLALVYKSTSGAPVLNSEQNGFASTGIQQRRTLWPLGTGDPLLAAAL